MDRQETSDTTIFRSAAIEDIKEKIAELDIKAEKRDPTKKETELIIEGLKTSEPAFSVYGKVKKYPYTAKYFGLEMLYGKAERIDKQIDYLDKYIAEEIRDERLENTTKAADSILEKLQRDLFLPEHLDSFEKIKRLNEFAKILREEKKLKERKMKLLGG